MAHKNRFKKPDDVEEVTFEVTLIDLLNGVDCVSGGSYEPSEVVAMVGHLVTTHTNPDLDEEVFTSVEVDDPVDTSHMH